MGFLLAGGTVAGGGWAKLVPAAVTSVLLYAGGLVQNDLAHVAEDARTRPQRPLPSGAVSMRSAWAALCGLVVTAMLVAGFVGQAAASHLAFGLVVLITLYNYSTSRIGILGPVNMGLCRAGSVLLGASAVGGWEGVVYGPVPLAAATIGLYVVAITLLAMKENERSTFGVERRLPCLVLLLGGVLIIITIQLTDSAGTYRLVLGPDHVFRRVSYLPAWAPAVGAVSLGVGVLWSIYCGHRLRGVCEPPRIGKTIGMLVRSLLVVQASLAMVAAAAATTVDTEGVWFAAGLFAVWPVTGLLARRFASS